MTRLIISMLLAACLLPLSGPVRQAAAQDLEKVRITHGYANFSLTHLAKLSGLFEEHGLDARVSRVKSGRANMEHLVGDKADYVVASSLDFASFAFDHPNLRILINHNSTDSQTKVLADKGKNIRSIKDLQGKTIAFKKAGNAAYYLHNLLREHGLTLDDVVHATRGDRDLLPERLVSGEIDAYVGHGNEIVHGKELLGGKATIFAKRNLYQKQFCLITTAEALQQRPEVAVAILETLKDAMALAKKRPNQAVAMLAEAFELPEKTVRENLHEYTFDFDLDKGLLLSLETIGRWLLDRGYVQGPLPNFLEMIDTGPLYMVDPEGVLIAVANRNHGP
jgi:sulfonate transport system substrate-binding protein